MPDYIAVGSHKHPDTASTCVNQLPAAHYKTLLVRPRGGGRSAGFSSTGYFKSIREPYIMQQNIDIGRVMFAPFQMMRPKISRPRSYRQSIRHAG